MASASPEKNIGQFKSPESAPSVVSQPVKIESHLTGQLGSFLEDINRISESAGSRPGEQWSDGSGSSTAVATTGGSAAAVSTRDQAIANIPAPTLMQKQLEKHIRMEVKQLRKQAQAIARMNKPGAAFHLNQLYTRIRHLNALLAEIFEASYEVLKRLFVRVFIDKQSII
jgi:hypothetical protein